MGVGNSGSRIGTPVLALLAATALCAALIVGEASAAKLVGKDGKVYACYKAKGKRKGAVRLVAEKGKCHKGEKKVSWSVTGPSGESGTGGENGTAGEGGAGGEKGATATQGLEKQVQSLTGKVTQLESVLKGITNTELLGALGKLQGVSGAGLQEAVAKVPVVNTLCKQSGLLTTQANALDTALGGFELGGTIPPLLHLITPMVPQPLESFSC
jgi:hypothetical protein